MSTAQSTQRTEIFKTFCQELHTGQKRKFTGEDYFTGHCVPVAEIAVSLYDETFARGMGPDMLSVVVFEKECLTMIGYGHDLLEDTDLSEDDLALFCQHHLIPYEVFLGIKTLTRKPTETYLDFILRISKRGHLFKIAKMADLTHNMKDLKEGSLKDKYRLAYHILERSL